METTVLVIASNFCTQELCGILKYYINHYYDSILLQIDCHDGVPSRNDILHFPICSFV